MEKVKHLRIIDGPSLGLEIHVPRDGVRIGRSSRNDISIADDAMSRFQCRFFIKPGEGLWVSDLGSANGTMVNGTLVQEQRLQSQDEILAGDTRIRVLDAGNSPVPMAEGPVDLGFDKEARSAGPAGPNAMRKNLMWLVAVLAVLVVLIFIKKPLLTAFESPGPVSAPAQVVLPELELSFERVEGSASNIFRYSLELKQDLLRVEVDDLASDRHIRRDKKVTPELQRELAHSIESTGILELREDYSGLAPGLYDSCELSVTLGAVTHRVRVLNQPEPEVFASTRAMIEEFGKNELGLAALGVDPAALVEKAQLALLQGKKMWEEREVRHENLYKAIQAYKECEWYLETIQPKPAFLTEATSEKENCIRLLQKRYEDVMFLAEKAIKLREWKDADRHLKVICEMIPDRSDERNRNASKNLVDVERHLETEK